MVEIDSLLVLLVNKTFMMMTKILIEEKTVKSGRNKTKARIYS